MRVIRHERVRYACPCCDGGLRLAAEPPEGIPKGLLSEAALAPVITSKDLDGLPLYRQASGSDSTGPPIRLFGYSPSRSTHAARTLYEGMRPGGALISDGYEPYAAIAEPHRLVHLGRWAHCRRYFHEALQALPKDKRGPEQLPARFIELICGLYKVEADARRDDLDAHALQQQRTRHSKPVLEQVEALALQPSAWRAAG